MIVTYQPILVFLSINVAILGSLTALALASATAVQAASVGQRRFSLANAGLIMGATIWSMHFVAMMAVDLPVLVNYDLVQTTGSIGIAVVATGVGLSLAGTRKLGRLSIPLGGVLMGLGISGMHYLGMGAIRGCGLAYDPQLVAASVAIAIAASTAALWFAFRRRNLLMTLAGGVVQGLAIASMHYTAMAATYFVPLEAEVALSTPLFSQDLMAYIIACGMIAISIGNLAMSGLISRDTMTREQIRLVQESFNKIDPIAPRVVDLLYRRLFELAPPNRPGRRPTSSFPAP